MKNSVIITLIIALFTLGNAKAQESTTDKFTVEVNGMGCPYCASGIEHEFDKLDGISNIKIDINTATLTFDYPANLNLSLEEVIGKVTKAGYTARGAEVQRANGKVETFEGEGENGSNDEK